ncbi:ABC transporter ATP-binding protein, partial [Rothia sp. AR01]
MSPTQHTTSRPETGSVATAGARGVGAGAGARPGGAAPDGVRPRASGGPASVAPDAAGAPPVLRIEDLGVAYSLRGAREPRQALHGVSLSVARGGMTAVVGESGSGKSTTASAVIGMLAGNASVTSGSVRLGERELLGASEPELQRIRGAHVGYIPQDPGNSLNPLKTVGANVAEALRIHRRAGRAEARERVLGLLERVGLDRPELRARQFPHELSGGMRQRVLIASAIALSPELIIADEPTSALDVTVQQRILDLLDDLRREEGTSILFITHDLAVAGERADRDLDAMVELFGAAERYVEQQPGAGAREFLEYLDSQDLPMDTLAPAATARPSVALATPASAAGREWGWVHVAAVQQGTWPNTTLRGGLLATTELSDVVTLGWERAAAATHRTRLRETRYDELRTFATAVSRAREKLVVSAVSNAEEEPSEFLDVLAPQQLDGAGLTEVRRPMTLRGLVAELRLAAQDSARP